MDIRDIRGLKHRAGERLDGAQDAGKITLIYAGITLGASVLVTVINYALGLQISQMGGLRNMSVRSVLSTVQTVLPLIQILALMCLDLGYRAAMLRIGRGQYTSPQTLRAGIQRFWTMLRCTLLESVVYVFLASLSFYLAMQIFLFSPLSGDVMELLLPIAGAEDPTLLLDEAAQLQLLKSLIPMFILMLVLMAVLTIPAYYRLRMVNYVMLDKPGMGAFVVLRESTKMMRKNGFALFRVDLSLWWYHALTALAVVVCYGDSLLSLAGVTLPWSEDVSYFVFYGLYLVMLFAITWFFRGRVEVTYALAYDAVRPREESDGVVLGNIFEM